MLTIRQESMDAFSRYARSSFEARAVEHLAQRFAEWGGPANRERLQAFVQRASQQASAFNITRQIDVIRYLELLLLLGPGDGGRLDLPGSPIACRKTGRLICG